MSHAPNHVFDAAVEEVIDRLDVLDSLPTLAAEDILPILEAMAVEHAGDVEGFDAAVAELGQQIAVALTWDRLPEWLRKADDGVRRRFKALAQASGEADVLATPAIEMATVAERRAARLMAKAGEDGA